MTAPGLPCFGSWNGIASSALINRTSGTGAPPTITVHDHHDDHADADHEHGTDHDDLVHDHASDHADRPRPATTTTRPTTTTFNS